MTTPPGDQPPGSQPPGDQPGGEWQPQWQPQYPQTPQTPQPYAPMPAGYGYAVPDHPKATTSMVLGILGVVLCQVVAPFAWVMGKRTVTEIDASGGRLGGRGSAQAGYILGIIGTVLLGLTLVFLIVYVIIIVAVIGGTAASNA